jgi:hypothetical protein
MRSDAARQRADESVSTRFTRVMNATTSRWGVLTDPPVVAVATAPGLIALVAAIRLELAPAVVLALEVATAAPLSVAIVAALALLGARSRVVEWLAGLPFPVENLNAVLNGLGESLEITFRDACPRTAELNAALDPVSAESFVTRAPDADAGPDPHVVEVRIGVVDSKRNPSVSNHRRLERVQALVGRVLLPLAERYPIVEVRVK